jgi:hypothetical protein
MSVHGQVVWPARVPGNHRTIFRAATGLMLAGGCVLFASAPTTAADTGGAPPVFEISPFAGYRVGGSLTELNTQQTVNLNDHGSFALAFDAKADPQSQYELFYSQQSTAVQGVGFAPVSLKIQYLHIGGTVTFDESQPRVQPYLAGGFGFTRLAPDSEVGQEDTRFSLSLALGLRLPVSQRVRLRLEARGYATFMSTDTAIFCRSDQSGAACQLSAKGSTFFQFDFLGGISFAF